MNAKRKYVVIPWDFSDGSLIALKHAVQLAKVVNNGIVLMYLHNTKSGIFGLSSKSLPDEELAEIQNKLDIQAKKVTDEYEIECIAMARQGVAKEVAQDIIYTVNANLLVMYRSISNTNSTFKVKDFLKIMRGTFIPFIIVEKEPRHDYYKEIVVPIDDDKKYRESLAWIIYLANYYKCNINLMKPFFNDGFRKKDMSNNMYFTKKMLDKQNIIYGVKTAKKKLPFKDQVFDFAQIIEADMILMMAKHYIKWLSKKGNDNFDIPVMCIPPRADLTKYSSFV